MMPQSDGTGSRTDWSQLGTGEFSWDESAAQRIEKFFSRVLRHPRGRLAGEPFVPMEWTAKDWLRPLFGWKRADGTRRFRRSLIYVPKKNSKSMTMGGIGLYLLTSDGEEGARVYAVATDEDQTDNVMGAAFGMVRRSPLLKKRLVVRRSTNTIYDPETDSTFQGIPASALDAEGLDASGLICDEIHVWRGRALWDALNFADTARRQPLHVSITTAGVWDPEAIWMEELKYARGVLEGKIDDPSYFALLYEASKDDDLLSPATWRKANPSLGIIFSEERFREDLRRSQKSPSAWSQFLRYRLNIPAMSVSAEYDVDLWNAAKREFTEEDLRGRACYAAIDLASSKDLTALVLVFPPVREGEPYFVLCYIFLPRETAEENARKGDMRYTGWEKEGWIELTPGARFDHDRMREKIKELSQKFRIVQIVADPWNAVKMMTDLTLDGFHVEEFRQGIKSFAGVMREFEGLYRDKKIAHNGNQALAWTLGNVVVDVDKNNNKAPNKKRSGEKIDPAVAMLMALDRAIVGDGKGRNPYETRDLAVS